MLGAISISAAAMVATPIAASASSKGSCVSGNGVKIKNNPLLCKGLAFYKGKTVTVIIGASVGGSADTQTRVQIPYIAQFLGANVVGEDISGSNGVQGMDATAHATANGLTVGTLNLATGYAFQIENQPGLNFNPGRLAWISENASTTNVIIAHSNSACTSITAMKSAATPCAIASSATGIAPMQAAILFGLLHVPVKWLNVYASNSAVTAGFARGDAPVTVMNLTSSGPFLQANQAVTVASAIKIPSGTAYRAYVDAAPTMAQLVNGIKTTNKKTLAVIAAFKSLLSDGNSPIVTQTAVSPEKLAALRAAFAWMGKQASIGPAMLAVSSAASFIDGAAAKVGFLGVEKNLPIFAPYVLPVLTH